MRVPPRRGGGPGENRLSERSESAAKSRRNEGRVGAEEAPQ
jgi:hypothetical protein